MATNIQRHTDILMQQSQELKPDLVSKATHFLHLSLPAGYQDHTVFKNTGSGIGTQELKSHLYFKKKDSSSPVIMLTTA